MLCPLLKGVIGRAVVIVISLLVGHIVAYIICLWEVIVFPVICQELWFHDNKIFNPTLGKNTL
jgi:hypothetical protein